MDGRHAHSSRLDVIVFGRRRLSLIAASVWMLWEIERGSKARRNSDGVG
jgi:hypothetical protein